MIFTRGMFFTGEMFFQIQHKSTETNKSAQGDATLVSSISSEKNADKRIFEYHPMILSPRDTNLSRYHFSKYIAAK